MKRRITAAVMGALLAAPLIAGCSDHNSGYEDYSGPAAEDISTAVTEAETAEPASGSRKTAPDDFGKPSEVSEMNRPQYVYLMDNGAYVYLSGKKGQDGAEDVYILDDRKGHTEELSFPSKSVMLHTDGSRLYYYAPDKGIFEYRDGKSKLLSAEAAKRDCPVPEREEFFFTDDTVYFTCSSDSGTVIKSMDYSGKLTDAEYSLEYKNAHIAGIAEINGKKSFLCTYPIGTSEHIRIYGENGRYTDINSGSSPYIVDDSLYYIKNRRLCRNTLTGDNEEYITDAGCIGYCIYNEKLYYTDVKTVFSVGKDGKPEEILRTEDLEGTDFIEGLCTAGGRLFVSGGSGAFGHSLAEIDENGKVTDKIHSDK